MGLYWSMSLPHMHCPAQVNMSRHSLCDCSMTYCGQIKLPTHAAIKGQIVVYIITFTYWYTFQRFNLSIT